MRLSLKANITKTEADTLDKILKAAGFHNRTEYLTALIQQTIYADNTIRPLPPSTETWITTIRTAAQTQDTVRTTTIQALDQIAFPVIAMRGGKTALRLLRHEIEDYVLEHCGLLPEPDDLESCMTIYQNTKRTELIRHRPGTLRARRDAEQQSDNDPDAGIKNTSDSPPSRKTETVRNPDTGTPKRDTTDETIVLFPT